LGVGGARIGDPSTREDPGWLLTHAVATFGERRIADLKPHEIATWRMTIKPSYRVVTTQALQQVLARAVVWSTLEVNPAKQGVENPQRRRTEKRPFESWDEIEALAERLGQRLDLHNFRNRNWKPPRTAQWASALRRCGGRGHSRTELAAIGFLEYSTLVKYFGRGGLPCIRRLSSSRRESEGCWRN
jgi:hypothetical protein